MSYDANDYGVTPADVDWLLEKGAASEWIFAKTYADTAPHEYTVLGRTPDWSREDFIRAGRVIRTFGQPGKFYDYTNIYLVDRERGVKYWTMDDDVELTDLVNRATLEQVYGEQNAPATSTGDFTLYDQLSSGYDAIWKKPSDLEENSKVRRLIHQLFNYEVPNTLDLGCGTGLLLDEKVCHPALFTGVDPSQGMLNELVRKHPRVRKVIPATAEEVLFGDKVTELRGPYELVSATFASASYLSPEALRAMLFASKGWVIQMTYEEGYFPEYYDELAAPLPATSDKARETSLALVDEFGGRVFKIGAFHTAVIRGQA